MKKETLLGMEVYYEDNPQQCEPRGHKGVKGVEGITLVADGGVWAFGDSDEEDDFDDVYGESSNYDIHKVEPCDTHDFQPLKSHFQREDITVPIKGRIYSVEGLDITAKLKEIRPLTKTAGILEMSHHGNTFYINPSDLKRASPEEVTQYLEESDYNNTP
jgi:hypothetical protein